VPLKIWVAVSFVDISTKNVQNFKVIYLLKQGLKYMKYFLTLLNCSLLGITLAVPLNLAQADQPAAPQPESAPPPATAPQPEQLLGKMPALESAVGKYMEAWQKQDFNTMRGHESWEGGEELNEVKYIQSFDSNFKIHSWKVTKVEKVENGEYRVLVLISHNPPKQVASMLPPGRTVNSTLIQWWKKQGDNFVHLLHLERKRLLQPSLPQPAQPLPVVPEAPKSS